MKKFFLAFGVGRREQWVKGFMNLRCRTQVKSEFPVYATLLKKIQVRKWSVSIIREKSIRACMSSILTVGETSYFDCKC